MYILTSSVIVGPALNTPITLTSGSLPRTKSISLKHFDCLYPGYSDIGFGGTFRLGDLSFCPLSFAREPVMAGAGGDVGEWGVAVRLS